MSDNTFESFLKERTAFAIAPAGYGKTYTIASCVKKFECEKSILVLTHTHAGIASLKQKLSKGKVDKDKYKIDTISGFTQHYVLSFYEQDIIGQQGDNDYFKNVLEKAIELFKKPIIKRIFLASYSHLIVDEYQDCTKKQHLLISILADYVPTHLFGDPLQGIFDFEGNPSVKFPDDFSHFKPFYFLQTPYRWLVNGNSQMLGEKIKEYRELLEEGSSLNIDSDNQSNIEVVCHEKVTPSNEQQIVFNTLRSIIQKLNMDSTLVIMPSFMDSRRRGLIDERADMLRRFDYNHEFVLVEAIDDKAYYRVAQNIDSLISSACTTALDYLKIKTIFNDLSFDVQVQNEWFNQSGLIKKKSTDDKLFSEKLKSLIDNFFSCANAKSFLNLLEFYCKKYQRNIKRLDLVRSIVKSLRYAEENNITVYQAMINTKNQIRRSGRKIIGKCFGTTLLTKGLEFDAVIILYANRIEDKRNFYVAISRACKKLVIFTESKLLNFKN